MIRSGLRLWMLLAAVAAIGVLLGIAVGVARMSAADRIATAMVASPLLVFAVHRTLHGFVRRATPIGRKPEPRPGESEPPGP